MGSPQSGQAAVGAGRCGFRTEAGEGIPLHRATSGRLGRAMGACMLGSAS